MSDGFSEKAPYLFKDYFGMRSTTMEREIFNPNSPEKNESQFKKPYLFQNHPMSEQTLSPPGMVPYPHYPPGPMPPYDCSVAGDAIGGGQRIACDPGVSCAQWVFSCAHKIKGFRAVGGIIQSIEYFDDAVKVTACWNEAKGVLSPIAILTNDGTVTGDELNKGACLGKGHSSSCVNCEDCRKKNVQPTLTYATQQMSVNGTLAFSATGGGGEPYTWSILTGGGSFSSYKTKAGQQTIYTAPATNPDCVNNPAIRATDVCGTPSKTVFLAINAMDSEGAYQTWSYPYCYHVLACSGLVTGSINWFAFGCDNTLIGQGICSTDCVAGQYDCPDNAVNELVQGQGGPCSCAGWSCEGLSPQDLYSAHGPKADVRTAGQKAAGCCPVGLI